LDFFVRMKYIVVLIFFLATFKVSVSQTLCNGHSHNDYLQKSPLQTALKHGFYSVEADIFLKKGELVLAHTPIGKIKNKSLEEYYLKPLFEIYNKYNNKKIYDFSERELLLFIDIKSDANTTIKALEKTIEKYKAMLTYCENDVVNKKAVTIIISGNRDKNYISNISKRYFFINGRLEDVDKELDTKLYPVISDNYKKVQKNKTDLEIEDLIKKAKQQGKLIRFWNVKNDEKNWTKLNKIGASLINVDKIEEYYEFYFR